MYYYDQRVKLVCDLVGSHNKIEEGTWGTVRKLYPSEFSLSVKFDNRRGVHTVRQTWLSTQEQEVAYSRARWRGVRNPTESQIKSPELHRAEMLDSYMLAIAECGGSAASFISKIETMTVKEMIDRLAQNGVRFTTDRKGVPKT